MKKIFSLLLILPLCFSSLAWGYGTSKTTKSKPKKTKSTPKKGTTTSTTVSTSSTEKPKETPTLPSENVQETVQNTTGEVKNDHFWDTLSTRGTLGVSFNSYSTDENPDNFALEGNVEIAKKWDSSEVVANIALLYDTNDKNRRFLLLNELYYKTKFDNSTLVFGRNIRSWGVMEAYSTSDVFNTKNYLSDSFDMSSKYGALSGEYTYTYDDSKFSIIAKLEENDQPYPASDNIYNYLPLPYNGDLKTEKSNHRPTVYLKYSRSYNDLFQSDYSLILQNGYDNKRYFDFTNTTQSTLEQHAYLVNKALFFGNVTYENLIIKLEAAYTDVVNDPNISDYIQTALGVEYLPSQSINGAELRFLLEYYNYAYQNTNKLENQDFSEMFDNDLFLGVQSSFGDAGSSEIKGGILYDFTNNEQTYVLTFGTRMQENYRLSMEWMVISPGDDPLTALGQMGQFNQVTFRANYFF
jgi:hypothetical protein